MTSYDVVTLGETMIRLTPPNLKRIEQTTSFDIEVGGSESNLACGLARLGLKVAWISRLTNNALGQIIARTIAGQGVDTSHIVWTDEDRIGLYFLEEGKAPRHSRVIYDRARSAASQMKPEELPSSLFQKDGARLLHLSGITPAIGANAADTARHALRLAKDAGWLVSFDLNYRSLLWTSDEARTGCDPFAESADVLFVPLGDARVVYNFGDKVAPETILMSLSERYTTATLVMTMGSDGAMARQPSGPIIHQDVFPAEEVGRLGGGDAFSAGFLYAYLTSAGGEEKLATALRWGAAMAAYKYSILGDIPIIDRHEIERLVNQGTTNKKLVR